MASERRKRGFLLSFEGIEGCGKTTQLRRLAHRLRSLGYLVIETREPLLVKRARAEAAEDPHHVEQHEQVEDADDPEERPGHTGADVAAPVLERRDARLHRSRPDGERRRQHEHDRRENELSVRRGFRILSSYTLPQ